MGNVTRYSASEKLEILQLVWEANLSVRYAVRQIGISRSTYYDWLDRYEHGGFEGASGRKTVHERLLVAKLRILAAIHIRVREILNGNLERDLVMRARYVAGETLSALAREFCLTPQRVFQIING